MPPLPPPAIQPSTAFVPIFNINWSSCPFANVPGLRCYQFYLAETEEERYLKTILEDHVKFPTSPRRLNGDVIVDHHPEYLPITSQESDTNIISNVFQRRHRAAAAATPTPSCRRQVAATKLPPPSCHHAAAAIALSAATALLPPPRCRQAAAAKLPLPLHHHSAAAAIALCTATTLLPPPRCLCLA